MASCPKCNGTLFQLEDAVITHSKYKMFFVACSSCHTAICTVDYTYTAAEIAGVEAKVDKLRQEVAGLTNVVQQLAILVQRK